MDQIKSIQDMLKVMTDGHGLVQRVENEPVRGNDKDAENLHCAFPNILCLLPFADDLWQRFLNTLVQIQSTTEQMLKLLTDGHGFGPRPSAAGSSKRQRVEKAEDQGGELQEKEEGDDEEADAQQEKEEGNDEEKGAEA